MDIHRTLVEKCRIYPEELVSHVKQHCPHWERATWREREVSLRHDYVCILLPNGEKHTNGQEEKKKSSSSGSKKGSEIPMNPELAQNMLLTAQMRDAFIDPGEGPSGTQASIGSSSEASDEDWPDFSGLESDKEEVEQRPMPEADAMRLLHPDQCDRDYRYTLLEAVTGARRTQQAYLSAWKIKTSKQWDLLDRKEKKLIEVKVTERDPDTVIQEVLEECDVELSRVGVVVAHLGEQIRVYYHNCETMKGEASVVSFLRQRRLLSLSTKPDLPEETERNPLSFNHRFDMESQDWLDQVILESFDPLPPNIEERRPANIEPFELGKLLEALEDPTKRDAPTIKWTGKILPYSWVAAEQVDSDRDSEIVLQLMQDIDLESAEPVNWNPQKAERLRANAEIIVRAFKERIAAGQTHFKVRTTRTGYRLVDKDLAQKEGLKEALTSVGVGMKPQKRSSNLEDNMKQPEPRKREDRVRGYDEWIRELVHSEARVVDVVASNSVDFTEADCVHPWDALAQNMCREMYNTFCRLRIGHTCYRMMGFYSRLGGPYALDLVLGKGAHASVTALPIYHIVYSKEAGKRKRGESSPQEEKRRVASGFAIRGPHHVKANTDKINLIVFEKVAPECQPHRVLERGILTKKGWFIRSNAIRRADPTYLTFLHNSLFVPINYNGELVFSHRNFAEQQARPDRWAGIFRDVIGVPRQYHAERLSEIVLMGILGGSQEEGHMAILRMVYMLLLESKNSEPAFVMKLRDLADAMNECLIDSPMAMYWHVCLIDLLRTRVDIN